MSDYASADWAALILTDDGIETRQKVIAENLGLRFTRATISNGVSADDDNVFQYTGVKSPIMNMAVKTSFGDYDIHRIEVLLDNHDLTDEIYIREIGIFSRIEGTGRELMYGYTYAKKGYEVLPGLSSGRRAYNLVFNARFSRTENVEIIYDASAVYATREGFELLYPTEHVASIPHVLQ